MRLFFLIITVLAVAACGPSAEKPLDRVLEDSVERFNSHSYRYVEQSMPGTTARAQVEGQDTMVVAVEGVRSGMMSMDSFQFSAGLRKTFCAQDAMIEFFERGAKIRIEMQSDFGEKLPTIYLATCAG